MIKTKNDLKYYLQEDARVNNISKLSKISRVRNKNWKFQKTLRKHEYFANNSNCIINKILCKYYSIKHTYLGDKLGFEIPINTFGYGLRINHKGLIIVNQLVRVGNYCDIHQGVNIGQGNTPNDIPKLGNKIYIAPGVKIFGKIEIANSIAIGANAVVNKSFLEEDITIAGLPAKKIKDVGTSAMRVAGTM